MSDLLQGLNAYNTAVKNVNKLIKNDENEGGGDTASVSFDNSPFGGMVKNALTKTFNSLEKTESITTKSLTENVSLTDVVQAINEADLTIQAITSIRDKAIAAYQDIIKMPI